MSADSHRIAKIELDPASLGALSADAEHERRVAIFDLLESNRFELVGHADGPYYIYMSTQDNRLGFDVRTLDGKSIRTIVLSMSSLRKIVKDYIMICESYYHAIRTATPAQIEAVDMGRRGLHNEASEILRERLSGKVEVDLETARRLFTLICALHRPR